MQDGHDTCQICDSVAEVGVTGIKDGNITGHSFCYECYHKLIKKGEIDELFESSDRKTRLQTDIDDDSGFVCADIPKRKSKTKIRSDNQGSSSTYVD